jgi:hypothetical protein
MKENANNRPKEQPERIEWDIPNLACEVPEVYWEPIEIDWQIPDVEWNL